NWKKAWQGGSAICSISATFQADTIIRLESGDFLSCSITCAIWSICRPSGVGQERHCEPYTGPKFPFSSAHSSQILTPFSFKYWIFVSPFKNQINSCRIERRCSFFVVTNGKPSFKLKRIWYPNTLRVPVPVRSVLSTPFSYTCLSKSSYCLIMTTKMGLSLLFFLTKKETKKSRLASFRYLYWPIPRQH